MNIKPTARLSGNETVSAGRIAVTFVAFALLMAAALFGAAGRLDWTMGWVYLVLTTIVSVASRLLVARRHPDLIAERVGFAGKSDAKNWDRPLVLFIGVVGPLSVWIVAGLSLRLEWLPEVPVGLQFAGLAIYLLGGVVSVWAMAVNRFFSTVVRIQRDRGQAVVSTGPYGYVRHPGYTGAVLAWLGTALTLASWWALVPAVLVTIVYVVRTALEDRVLQAELDGYREYAGQVRYRLLPGVW